MSIDIPDKDAIEKNMATPSLAVNPDIIVRSSPASKQRVQIALCTEDGKSCLEPAVGHWEITGGDGHESTIPFATVYETAIKVSRNTPASWREKYNTFYIQANFFSLTPSGYYQPRIGADDMAGFFYHDFLGSSGAVKFDPWEASTQQIVLSLVEQQTVGQRSPGRVIHPTSLE